MFAEEIKKGETSKQIKGKKKRRRGLARIILRQFIHVEEGKNKTRAFKKRNEGKMIKIK